MWNGLPTLPRCGRPAVGPVDRSGDRPTTLGGRSATPGGRSTTPPITVPCHFCGRSRHDRQIHQSWHCSTSDAILWGVIAPGVGGMQRKRRLASLLAGLACLVMLAQPVAIAACPLHGRGAEDSCSERECHCRGAGCQRSHDCDSRGSVTVCGRSERYAIACETTPARPSDVPRCSCQRQAEHAITPAAVRPLAKSLASLSPLAVNTTGRERWFEVRAEPDFPCAAGRSSFLCCRIQV